MFLAADAEQAMQEIFADVGRDPAASYNEIYFPECCCLLNRFTANKSSETLLQNGNSCRAARIGPSGAHFIRSAIEAARAVQVVITYLMDRISCY